MRPPPPARGRQPQRAREHARGRNPKGVGVDHRERLSLPPPHERRPGAAEGDGVRDQAGESSTRCRGRPCRRRAGRPAASRRRCHERSWPSWKSPCVGRPGRVTAPDGGAPHRPARGRARRVGRAPRTRPARSPARGPTRPCDAAGRHLLRQGVGDGQCVAVAAATRIAPRGTSVTWTSSTQHSDAAAARMRRDLELPRPALAGTRPRGGSPRAGGGVVGPREDDLRGPFVPGPAGAVGGPAVGRGGADRGSTHSCRPRARSHSGSRGRRRGRRRTALPRPFGRRRGPRAAGRSPGRRAR